MVAFLIRRIGQSIFVILAMAALVFLGVFLIGNPIDVLLAPDADQIERAQAIERLGLDKPLWQQFLIFLLDLARGDLGTSFVHGTSAVGLILERLPATMELAFVALTLAIVVGIPLGVIAGLRRESWLGRTIMTGSIVGFSLPNFWFGIMLILCFAVTLQWLPAGGRGPTGSLFGVELSLLNPAGWPNLLMPALTLAIYKVSLVIRLAYSGTREAMLQDYVRFARAKGLSPQRILGVHVLKNILIPIVTVLGLELGSMIAFAVVTESVFAWPGIGKLLIDSIARLDRPVIVAYLMIVVALFALINLVVDILYSVLDPRVRLSDTGN
ncbi:ABC transporter permease [Afipia sp. P52-10]|jgi:peptide/nickel transport system permease protein|uniref:ABC transporter permease n=1 Tax=Afipia sp. P52-10 TaxID=1429916 RepID=UPI0003DF1FCB|nr:ABC transporter permease [Afipia sp. P52-10]ETR76122.1 ABC transporter permease [Afipia sp. P52-10]